MLVSYNQVANNKKSQNAIEKAIAMGSQTIAQVCKAIPNGQVAVLEKTKDGIVEYQVHAPNYLNDKFGLERATKQGFRSRDIKRAVRPEFADAERTETLKMFVNVQAYTIFTDGDVVTNVPLFRKVVSAKGAEEYVPAKVWTLKTVNECNWSVQRIIALLNQNKDFEENVARAEEEMKEYEETEEFFYLSEQHYEADEETGRKTLKKTYKKLNYGSVELM